MTVIAFNATASDLSELHSWRSNAELARRRCHQTDAWFDYVIAGGLVRHWIAYRHGRPLGHIYID